jgi:hypothetical protein
MDNTQWRRKDWDKPRGKLMQMDEAKMSGKKVMVVLLPTLATMGI